MSLGYPPIRPSDKGSKVIGLQHSDASTILPDVMLNGLHKVKDDLLPVHPLEYSEKNWNENKQGMDFAMLRNSQGLHAPLRLQMEQATVRKIQRLPCLTSSNVLMDSLTGRLDIMDFDDLFNDPFYCEDSTMPHVTIERKLGIL